jgi:hypothetical protein
LNFKFKPFIFKIKQLCIYIPDLSHGSSAGNLASLTPDSETEFGFGE